MTLRASVVLAIAFAASLWGQPLALAQDYTLDQRIAPPQAGMFSFGSPVAIDGSTAVVANRLEAVGANTQQGAVYVYIKVAGSWSLQQRIVTGDGRASDSFGSSVGLSGDTLVVGAPSSGASPQRSGKLYVFQRSGSAWTQTAVYEPGGGSDYDQFGMSVRLAGDTIVAGAPYANVGSGTDIGAVFVIDRVGSSWGPAQRVASPAGAFGGFGVSVDVSSTSMCVGAPNGSTESVYVFVKGGSGWTQQQRIPSHLGQTNVEFGLTCAIEGDALAVGASFADVGSLVHAGTAFVYGRAGGVWTLLQGLQPPANVARARFGERVVLLGDRLVVAAPGEIFGGVVAEPGSVHVFRLVGATWSTAQQLVAPSTVNFGGSVSLDARSLIVGTGYVSTNPLNGGYVYSIPDAPPTAPGAPTNVQATANGNTLNMTWGAPTSGAAPTGYTLIARASAGGAVLGTAPLGNVTSFSAVAPNGVFVLSLVASNAFGTGPESAGVSVTLPSLPAPPGAPTNLTSSVVGSTATLTWAAPASGGAVGNYVLAAGLTPGFAVPLGVLPLPAAPLSYAIPGIPPGTYYLRLQAQNAGGTSAASNEVTVTVAAPAAPGAPTLNAPTVSGSTVGLSWTQGGGGAPTSYVLTALTAGGVVLGSVPVTGASLSVPNVPSGSYLLRLVAVNSVGPSPVSNTVTLVVP